MKAEENVQAPSRGKPILFGVVVAFLIALALGKCTQGADDKAVNRIDQVGVIGVWYDDVGEATTQIERDVSGYRLKRTNGDGSTGEMAMRRDGGWLYLDDKFGTKYQVIGDRLELFDSQGFVRAMELAK